MVPERGARRLEDRDATRYASTHPVTRHHHLAYLLKLATWPKTPWMDDPDRAHTSSQVTTQNDTREASGIVYIRSREAYCTNSTPAYDLSRDTPTRRTARALPLQHPDTHFQPGKRLLLLVLGNELSQEYDGTH